MKKSVSVLSSMVAICVIAALPAFAEESMSPAKRKLLEKTKKDQAAIAAIESTGSNVILIDINTATKLQLTKLAGLSEADADKIIAARPYISKTELRKKNILPLATFYEIFDKVEAVVPPPKPLPVPAAPKQEAKGKQAEEPKRDVFKDAFKR